VRNRSRTQRRRNGRPGVQWVFAALLVAGNVALLTALAEEAPTGLFVGVDAAIRDAERADAPRHAPTLLTLAEKLRASGRREYGAELARFLWFREYSGVRSCLLASRTFAAAAAGRASRARGIALGSLRERLEIVGARLEGAEDAMNEMPIRGGTHRALSRSQLLYHRAVEAHRAGDLARAGALLEEAERGLGDAQRGFEREVDAMFANASAWAGWARSGIASSRKTGGAMILVDKLRHRCHLYSGGRLVRSYDADLGPHWLGNKEASGDKRTPEGSYHVTQKKSGGNTKYYRALLLNYPNEEDRRRFAAGKRAGRIGRGQRIGGLIEIHGDGGRGYDWTLGCVALRNKDAADLYDRVSVGTPVIIVGKLPDDLAKGD